MDGYLVPIIPTEKPKPIKRFRWKRSLIELNGKFEPKYRHDISGLLMQSYSEMSWFANVAYMDNPAPFRKHGISALEFDTKGIYLASVTKEGCLTVHDFETLYSQGLKEDETKHLLHISTCQQLDAVRWNLANQDEVACTSMKSGEVHIFDIGYISSDPVEVLRKRPTVTIHGFDVQRGFSDIAFSSNNDSRLKDMVYTHVSLSEIMILYPPIPIDGKQALKNDVLPDGTVIEVLASDTYGVINVWDRRMSDLPCIELTTNSNSTLNSIRLIEESQIIFGACKNGIIYMWDLRGGRSSTGFQSHKEPHYSPLASVKLASVLQKVESLKAQSNIVSKEIHSIDIDPSCPYQLAFHLDDGWSGILDIHNFQVTHVHCPPPPWLDGENVFTNLSCLRKPSWLPPYSIYAVGSAYNNGIHLLDFFPNPSSACHVDYDEDTQRDPRENSRHKQNRFVPLSEGVTACATHPLNGTIVAGTKTIGSSGHKFIASVEETCPMTSENQELLEDFRSALSWKYKCALQGA
ncbi:unnamed protein product [Camellia sinensis]